MERSGRKGQAKAKAKRKDAPREGQDEVEKGQDVNITKVKVGEASNDAEINTELPKSKIKPKIEPKTTKAKARPKVAQDQVKATTPLPSKPVDLSSNKGKKKLEPIVDKEKAKPNIRDVAPKTRHKTETKNETQTDEIESVQKTKEGKSSRKQSKQAAPAKAKQGQKQEKIAKPQAKGDHVDVPVLDEPKIKQPIKVEKCQDKIRKDSQVLPKVSKIPVPKTPKDSMTLESKTKITSSKDDEDVTALMHRLQDKSSSMNSQEKVLLLKKMLASLESVPDESKEEASKEEAIITVPKAKPKSAKESVKSDSKQTGTSIESDSNEDQILSDESERNDDDSSEESQPEDDTDNDEATSDESDSDPNEGANDDKSCGDNAEDDPGVDNVDDDAEASDDEQDQKSDMESDQESLDDDEVEESDEETLSESEQGQASPESIENENSSAQSDDHEEDKDLDVSDEEVQEPDHDSVDSQEEVEEEMPEVAEESLDHLKRQDSRTGEEKAIEQDVDSDLAPSGSKVDDAPSPLDDDDDNDDDAVSNGNDEMADEDDEKQVPNTSEDASTDNQNLEPLDVAGDHLPEKDLNDNENDTTQDTPEEQEALEHADEVDDEAQSNRSENTQEEALATIIASEPVDKEKVDVPEAEAPPDIKEEESIQRIDDPEIHITEPNKNFDQVGDNPAEEPSLSETQETCDKEEVTLVNDLIESEAVEAVQDSSKIQVQSLTSSDTAKELADIHANVKVLDLKKRFEMPQDTVATKAVNFALEPTPGGDEVKEEEEVKPESEPKAIEIEAQNKDETEEGKKDSSVTQEAPDEGFALEKILAMVERVAETAFLKHATSNITSAITNVGSVTGHLYKSCPDLNASSSLEVVGMKAAPAPKPDEADSNSEIRDEVHSALESIMEIKKAMAEMMELLVQKKDEDKTDLPMEQEQFSLIEEVIISPTEDLTNDDSDYPDALLPVAEQRRAFEWEATRQMFQDDPSTSSKVSQADLEPPPATLPDPKHQTQDDDQCTSQEDIDASLTTEASQEISCSLCKSSKKEETLPELISKPSVQLEIEQYKASLPEGLDQCPVGKVQAKISEFETGSKKSHSSSSDSFPLGDFEQDDTSDNSKTENENQATPEIENEDTNEANDKPQASEDEMESCFVPPERPVSHARSEADLHSKPMQFSFSMDDLSSTGTLTISFLGDKVNIQSSSKMFAKSSIDISTSQDGGTKLSLRPAFDDWTLPELASEGKIGSKSSSEFQSELSPDTHSMKDDNASVETVIDLFEQPQEDKGEEDSALGPDEKEDDFSEEGIEDHDAEPKVHTETGQETIPPPYLYDDEEDIATLQSDFSVSESSLALLSSSGSHENIIEDLKEEGDLFVDADLEAELGLLNHVSESHETLRSMSNETLNSLLREGTIFESNQSLVSSNNNSKVTPHLPLMKGSLLLDNLREVDLVNELDNYDPLYEGAKSEVRLCKILFIGSSSTGKTSLIRRYVKNTFAPTYRATIGADFLAKVVHWDAKTTFRLQLWDIAGQDRFSILSRSFYKDAVGAFIVADVTRPETLHAAERWKEELDSKVQGLDGNPIPCFLLGNKCDLLDDPGGTLKQYSKLCDKLSFQGWLQTSAKDDINVTDAIYMLLKKINANPHPTSTSSSASSDDSNIVLAPEKKAKRKSCLC